MVVADAVIGLPDEATALEYYLESRVSNVGGGKHWHRRVVAAAVD